MPGPPKPPPGSGRKPKPPPPPGSERRKHQRYEVIAQIEIKRSSEVWIVPIENISAGGVLAKFEAGAPMLDAGQGVSVFIDLGGMFSVNLDAEVIRVNWVEGGPTVAFMWTTSDPMVTRRLATVLDRIHKKRA